jgi:hypothetical protein
MAWRTGVVSTLTLALLTAGCGEVREHSVADGGNNSAGGGHSNGAGTGGAGRTGNAGAGGIDAPLAQAAVTFSVSPATGNVCTHTSPQLSLPSRYIASVQAELNCDLSMGCKPDDYVVVDRDRGSTVTCNVAAAGGNFNVQLDISVDGSATGDLSAQFGLNGAVTPTGGTVSINESNSIGGGGGVDDNCALTITAPHGVIKQGAIWGSFSCSSFRNPADIGDTGCDLEGIFLFENCAH